MGLVCDSLNMCDEREKAFNDGFFFKVAPNFCPWCGKPWHVEVQRQPDVEAVDEYIPFGLEWEKVMMRWTKKELVDEIRHLLML